MSLADLNINVTVSSAQAQRGLRDVASTAREQFDRSNASVDGFRQEILNASAALDRAARSMGANMDRAADQIESASKRSQDAIDDIGASASDVKFNGLAERISAAFGAAFGAAFAGTQVWLQKTEDFVVAKGKALAIGVAIAAVSATAGAIYVAYKVITGALGFIEGLFTGESYKSAAIDRLIARNTEQITGQTEAKKKAAEQDFAITKAMRENGDELDRLGVQYRDANGKLLDHRTVLQNVKTTLEQYADGYDQVRAAEAIGVGSLDEVNAMLEDHSKELDKARARMDDYLLAIGPQGQAEIARYQKAIKEFNEELQRTSDGFSHAIADVIMPTLTDLAEFFKDGFPVAVRWFRGSIATIASLFYGLEMAGSMALEALRASVQGIGELLVGVGSAAIKAFKGDFSGAADDMKRAWQLAGIGVSQALDQVAKDAEKNRDRMALAFGLDGFDAASPDGKKGKGTKAFVPPPKGQAQSVIKSPYQTYLDELDRMATKLEQNEYASMRLKAAQLAQKEGVTDLTEAYAKINRVQRGDSQKEVEAHSQALYESANAYEFETSLIGKNALEQEKLITAKRELMAIDQLIQSAKRAGRPLDQTALDDLELMRKAWTKQADEQINARDRISRSFDTGVRTTLNNYVRAATDSAANVASIINGGLARMEDAFINWAKTGKLSVKDLFGFMAEEYLRQIFRMGAAKLVAGGLGGIGGILSGIASIFGFGGKEHAGGLDYVPYNGYPATLHEGERVLTRQEASAARSSGPAGMHFDFSGQVLNVGAGVSRGEFASALKANNAQLMGQLQRMKQTGALA